MTAAQRWRGWLILVAALCLFSACSTGTKTHPIAGASATTGPVTVTTQFTSYTSVDAVGVTVANTSTTDFYATDGKSGCTLVQVELYDPAKGVWKNVDGCGVNQPAQVFAIAHGASTPYSFAPTSPADVNSWQPGTYRVSVTYSAQPDGISNPQEAHSAAFTVKG